jgi:hypothetical protein
VRLDHLLSKELFLTVSAIRSARSVRHSQLVRWRVVGSRCSGRRSLDLLPPSSSVDLVSLFRCEGVADSVEPSRVPLRRPDSLVAP